MTVTVLYNEDNIPAGNQSYARILEFRIMGFRDFFI